MHSNEVYKILENEQEGHVQEAGCDQPPGFMFMVAAK